MKQKRRDFLKTTGLLVGSAFTALYPAKSLIEKSNGFKELKKGEIKAISFEGEGYIGENVYDVDLKEFNLGLVDKKEEYELIIKVLFNGQVLLENRRLVEGSE